MRILVYEYTCAGGLQLSSALFRLTRKPEAQAKEDASLALQFCVSVPSASSKSATASSLQTEGWAMLAAVLEDFARVPGLEVVTMLDAGIPVSWRNQVSQLGITCRDAGPGEEATLFHELAILSDWTLVIAPEFADILFARCSWALAAGGKLLGSSPAAVALTADKLALSSFLRARGIRTPESRIASTSESFDGLAYPLVWKPRYGAGSLATFLVRQEGELAACAHKARDEGFIGECIVQPYVDGLAASVAFLIGPRDRLALPPAAQHLSPDSRFHYLGGSLPLTPGLSQRALALASLAVAAVPGLFGYVGVDVVLGEATDGSQDWVIEINPRLTTSYVGLRALAQSNLAEALLGIVLGDPLPKLAWRAKRVDFQTDGRIS